MGGLINKLTEALVMPNKGLVAFSCRFRFNGASAPTVFTGASNVVESIAHTGTGVWTITLKEEFKNWQQVISKLTACEIDAAGDGSYSAFGAMSASAGTIVVRAFNGSGIQEDSKAVGFADLTDSDGAQTFAFAAALPADAIVVGSRVDVTTAFTDGVAGVFTGDMGVNGADIDSMLDGAALGSIAEVSLPVGSKHAGHYGAITPAVTVLADVNVDTATAGALTAYVQHIDPAGAAPADIAAGSNDGNWCEVFCVLKYTTAEDGSA